MDKERNEITDILLNAALEIIYLLTGEDYTIVKKTSGDCVTPIIHLQESGGWSRTPDPITGPPPHSLRNKEKILELTKKMMELLTGEVPIRCQDVTVYFSMEEWEYIGGHWDLYKDVMMEDHQQSTSDRSSRRNPPERRPCLLYSQDPPEEDHNVQENQQGENLINVKVEVKYGAEEADIRADHSYALIGINPPERRPRPLYSQDALEEDPNVPENQQGEDLTHIKVKEEEPMMGDPRCKSEAEEEEEQMVTSYLCKREVEEEDKQMMGDHLCKSKVEEEIMVVNHLYKNEVKEEKIPVDFTTENHSEGNLTLSVSDEVEDEDLLQLSSGENLITLDVHQGHHSTDLSYNPLKQEEPSDQSQIVTPSTSVEGGERFYCGKRFAKSSGPKRRHAAEKPYCCPECGKCFTGKSALLIHVRIHTGERPYSCFLCGKCFTDKSSLNRHERIHTGEKPYSCSECGKCFTNKSQVVKHKQSHTGEKPYSCSQCSRCFSSKSHLAKHRKIHTGEKPFSCSICGKAFIDKSHLVRHDKIHTGEKPYSCSECGKYFRNKSNLLSHERTHAKDKAFSC